MHVPLLLVPCKFLLKNVHFLSYEDAKVFNLSVLRKMGTSVDLVPSEPTKPPTGSGIFRLPVQVRFHRQLACRIHTVTKKIATDVYSVIWWLSAFIGGRSTCVSQMWFKSHGKCITLSQQNKTGKSNCNRRAIGVSRRGRKLLTTYDCQSIGPDSLYKPCNSGVSDTIYHFNTVYICQHFLHCPLCASTSDRVRDLGIIWVINGYNVSVLARITLTIDAKMLP